MMNDLDSALRRAMAPLREVELHGSIVDRVMGGVEQELSQKVLTSTDPHNNYRPWILGIAAVLGLVLCLPGLVDVIVALGSLIATTATVVSASLSWPDLALPGELAQVGWVVLGAVLLSCWALLAVES